MLFKQKRWMPYIASALIAVGGSSAAMAQDDMYALNKTNGPSSNIAWDAKMVRFVSQGDPVRGAQINKDMNCAMCHGEKGVSIGRTWPHLAGQQAGYTYKMMLDYRDEKRYDVETAGIMVKLAQKMTEQDMADVAAFYASQPLPKGTPAKLATKEQADNVEMLMLRGDGKRMIPPCLSCHGTKAEGGKTDMPALAGQRPEYFRKTMQEYKSGQRHNDIYARMRYIAQALSEDEINAMAQYLAGMNDK
jgi:cytochrome c553